MRFPGLLVTVIIGSVPAAQAQLEPATASYEPAAAASLASAWGGQLATRPRLLGDPAGYRSALERTGIVFDLYYNQLFGVVLDGGSSSPDDEPYSGSVDLLVLADFERMGVVAGGEALMHVKAHYERNINPRADALSDPFDDADGNRWFYIDQLWYQHRFLDRRVQLRLGYLDQQTIIDRNAYANSEDRQFMATFLDNNNATVPLAIGIGAAAFFEPTEWLSWRVSLADKDGRAGRAGFDTAFDDLRGYFRYFELHLHARIDGEEGPLTGTYRFGLISDPRRKEVFGSSSSSGEPKTDREDLGFYASFDQLVFRERRGGDQGLGLFLRYGYRDGEVNQVEHFWSAGGQYRGALDARPDDVVGLGAYGAHTSSEYQASTQGSTGREVGCEVYYLVQLTPWLAFTPDVQYLNRPGARSGDDDVWVGGARVRIAF